MRSFTKDELFSGLPLEFLLRFCLATGLLFLLREPGSQLYLGFTVPIVNAAFAWNGLPCRYAQEGSMLYLVYANPGLRFAVHDIIYQNVMVGAALFVATPGRTWGWRGRWLGLALAVLWSTHVVSLYMGGTVIVWDYVDSLPAAQAADLARRLPAPLSPERDWLLSRLFGLWHTWGRPSIGVFLWAFAARSYIRLAPAGMGAEGRGADRGTRR